MSDAIRRLRLVHPFPSAVNAALVFGLALVAGGGIAGAALLALGMLGLQFCIGTVNDLIDAPHDALAKPWKPIPSRLVSVRWAVRVAVVAGGGGLLLAGVVGPLALIMAAVMLGCGLAYDLWLKPTRWAWACFSLAFAVLPVYAWYGATGTLPPRPELLLPLAAAAGPLIQLANGLADLERDDRSGLATLAVRLGRRRSLAVMAGLLVFVHGAAWLTLRGAAPAVIALAAAATLLAVIGLWLSAHVDAQRREVGWMIQAGSIALLGLGWLAAAVAPAGQ